MTNLDDGTPAARNPHRMRVTSARLAGIVALAFAATAFAQPDCNAVPEQYRARCEQAAKVSVACAGLEGDAKKSCEMRHLDYTAAKEKCASLAGKDRVLCEEHNRSMSAVSSCKGKAGPELEACIKGQAALRAQ